MIEAINLVGTGGTIWPQLEAASVTEGSGESHLLNTEGVNGRIVRELGITGRQIEVLQLLVAGMPNKTIASQLGIAESTVKTHVKSLFQVLKVNNRVACQNRARDLGLLQ